MSKNRYKEKQIQIREQAIEWQQSWSDNNYSYMELAKFGAYFGKMAKKYGLVKEFKENGII